MKKSIRGSGTIVALEDKPKSKCRKWQLRISTGLDYSTGKYRTRTRRVSGTYTEAQAALRAFIEEAEAGKTKPAKSYTVSEYIDAWSTQRAASGNYARRTIDNERAKLKNIERHIGRVKLAAVDVCMLESTYAKLRSGDSVSGRALSGKTLSGIHKSWMTMWNHAAVRRLVSKSEFDGIDAPKPDTKERRALKSDEAVKLIASLDAADAMGIAAILCVTCGLRRSEAMALAWSDVRDGILVVSKSLDEDGTVKSTKSKAGVRAIPLPKAASASLEKRRAAQDADFASVRARMPSESGWPVQGPDTPVVSNAFGEHLKPHSLSTWWRRNRSGLGMECTIHELRHTYLTMLAESGVHPTVMQELAGHSSSEITLEIYTHVQMGQKIAAVAGLDALLGE